MAFLTVLSYGGGDGVRMNIATFNCSVVVVELKAVCYIEILMFNLSDHKIHEMFGVMYSVGTFACFAEKNDSQVTL